MLSFEANTFDGGHSCMLDLRFVIHHLASCSPVKQPREAACQEMHTIGEHSSDGASVLTSHLLHFLTAPLR